MAKSAFRTSYISLAGTAHYITQCSLNDTYEEIDITDTGTSGNIREYTGGFRDASFTFTIVEDPTVADLTMNTEQSCTVHWEGKTYTGAAKVLGKTGDGSVGSAATKSYTARWTSAPVEAQAS